LVIAETLLLPQPQDVLPGPETLTEYVKFIFTGQLTIADQTDPDRDQEDGAYGVTLGLPIISPLISTFRAQDPGLLVLLAVA